MKLAARIITVRSACQRTGLPKDVQRALGVGRALRPQVVLSVLAGADLVIEAYEKTPDPLRAAGVLPDDIETIRGLRSALRAADQVQEAKKVSAKEQTTARKAGQARGEAAIAKILAAADLAFVDDPARRALYLAVVPKKPKKKTKAPTGGGAPA